MEGMKPLRDGFRNLAPRLEEFTSRNNEKLRVIYERLRNVPEKNPFYMQPESLLIWYLIETNKYDLMEEWVGAEWDPALLEDLSYEWGTPLPD
jgi:hypothetical protein